MSKAPLKREIITTKDGSKTIYIPELNENYHSVNGAIQESMHIFIDRGLALFKEKEEVRIFEVGFGTGLNALLTHHTTRNKHIFYQSIEKYPLKPEEVLALDYPKLLPDSTQKALIFDTLHSAEWERKCKIGAGFELLKQQVELSSFQTTNKFDLVYFDAFAPEIQPDLWTVEVFDKMFSLLNKGGVLVTYCAKGQVRRNMQAAGFKVERLPGPPGKREILRAIKD